MAQKRQRGTGLEDLRAENHRLKVENDRLRQLPAPAEQPTGKSSGISGWRRAGVAIFAVLAVLLLLAGNLLFWTGSTVVQNDRFNAATAPIIRQTSVQHAIAGYTTSQLFKNTDVNGTVQGALPAQAAFLATPVANQLRGVTQTTLQKTLARQQFQTRWNKLLAAAHARFISTVKRSGGNGVIDLNALYQQLSSSLKNTNVRFLADKQLPPKVGNIQVASGGWIRVLHNVAAHITRWRVLAILLFLLFAGLAIGLAQRRRRTLVSLSLYAAGAMLLTLIAARIAREVIADKVQAQYAAAAREAAQIFLHSLVIQSLTILVAFLLIALVAWLTGGGASARYLQDRLHLLVNGRVHHALFGEHENAFTAWVGRYKRVLQWLVVAVLVVLLLLARLTPLTLMWFIIFALVAWLIVELLAAPGQPAVSVRPVKR